MRKFTSKQFNQLLEYLYDLQRLGIKVGLEHTKQLLAECGNPQNHFRSIHLAGTNGKGSTAAMIASVLKEEQYKVGLYTSPHLIRFNERIRVNGEPIDDESIVDFVDEYKSSIENIKSTFFEATTALAFSYFKEQKVDIAVIETGLGGRLDSTNVLKPEVTVITPITADHTEILGNDLETIAFEKGGIIKEGIPLVLAEQGPQVERVILDIASERKAEVFYCRNRFMKDIMLTSTGTEFFWKGKKFKTALIGEHQAINGSLAIEAIKILNNNIKYLPINNGLGNTHWPGRLQLLSKTKPIYYDVAHNPHGIEVLLETLNKIFSKKPIGIMVLKADKELDKIAPKIINKFEELIITSEPDVLLMEAQDLYHSLLAHNINVVLEPDMTKAFERLEQNVSNLNPGIIFGSHYIGKTVFEKFEFSFDKGII